MWRRKKFPGKREGCKHERGASKAVGIHRVAWTVLSALADAASKLRGTRAPRNRVQPGHAAECLFRMGLPLLRAASSTSASRDY